MKLISYRRVSSNKQVTEGDSLEGQKRTIEQWVKRRGHEVVMEFVDGGVSAFKSSTTRKAFCDMLEYAVSNKENVDGIIVYKLSRFARNELARLQAEEELSKAGIQVFSATEEVPEDEDMAHFIRSVLGIVNEQQSRQNSSTVRDRLADTARNGFFPGGQVPFGFKSINATPEHGKKSRKILVVDEDHRHTVTHMFDLCLNGPKLKGCGVKEIANILNEEGLLKENKYWTSKSVHKVLSNSVYAGELVFTSNVDKKNPEKIVIKVPSIISKEVFKKASESLASRRLQNNNLRAQRSDTLLVGLLKCSTCNCRLTLMTGKGGQFKYYKCKKKRITGASKCTTPNFRVEQLDNLVLDTIATQLFVPENLAKYVGDLQKILNKQLLDSRSTKATISKRQIKVEQQIHNLWNAVSNEKQLIDDFFKTRMLELTKQFDSLSSELSKIDNREKFSYYNFSKKHIVDFCRLANKAVKEGQGDPRLKAFLKTLITEISIFENELILKGPISKITKVISVTKLGTDILSVPSIIPIWRRVRDSNPRWV